MKILILATGLIFVVGCTTTETKKNRKESVVFVKGSSSVAAKEVSRWAKCKTPKTANQKDFKDWVNNANVCVKENKWKRLGGLSKEMLSRFPDSPWGVYFESLYAEQTGNLIRANWMIDRALSMTPEVGLFHFQKARLLSRADDLGLARAQFRRAFTLDNSLAEAAVYLAKASFKDEDYSEVLNYLKSVPEDMQTESVLVITMESNRMLKKHDLALEAAKKLSNKYTKNFHYRLRVAQLLEEFPEKRKEALQEYENLLKSAKKLRKSQKLTSQIPDKISNLKRMIASSKDKKVESK